MDAYTTGFFDALREGTRRSAQVVVPLLLRLVRPRDVVDVGCGQGSWLAVFREHGVKEVCGVDGAYVDRARLEIPPEQFIPWDLTRPLRLGRRFDLAVSLEVAEHLLPECAETFIASLTGLAPLILFSAAVPHQGGTNHVNEQWPAYWARHFAARGYVPVDCLRRHMWDNEDVEWWYAQNSFLFAERGYLEASPALRKEYELAGGTAPALVHPKRYLELVEWGLAQCRQVAAVGAPAAGEA